MIDRYTALITGLLIAFITLLLGIHLFGVNNSVIAQDGIENMNTGSNEHYQVVLNTQPEVVEAGKRFTLNLDIANAADEMPVEEFDETHTKLLHLILVSQDLKEFLHLHPEYEGNGRFVLDDALLPAADYYNVFADFTPSGDEQQVVRAVLSTQSAEVGTPELAVSPTEVIAGSLQITLDSPQHLNAGIEQQISFHVTDAETGEDVVTLDEYLGAAGHLVILDETGEIYLHTHPADHDDHEHGSSDTVTYGPHLEFATHFPGTGLYKLWLQVQYKGEVYTAPFVVQVAGQAEAPEATSETHSTHD